MQLLSQILAIGKAHEKLVSQKAAEKGSHGHRGPYGSRVLSDRLAIEHKRRPNAFLKELMTYMRDLQGEYDLNAHRIAVSKPLSSFPESTEERRLLSVLAMKASRSSLYRDAEKEVQTLKEAITEQRKTSRAFMKNWIDDEDEEFSPAIMSALTRIRKKAS